MNKLFKLTTIVAIGLWSFTSCEDEVAPTITEVTATADTIYVGEQVTYEAKVTSDASFTYNWFVDNVSKSAETVFTFKPTKSGEYKVKVVVESSNGKDSVESILTVLRAAETIDFESLTLLENSSWNGRDESGSFTTQTMIFPNNYNTSWFSWSGYSYSNKIDVTTEGYTNDLSVFNSANGTNKFAVFYSSEAKAAFTNNQQFEIQSFEICNNTYAALSMKKGDTYSKKFGGTTGNDPDYFKIIVTGYNALDIETGKVEAYLADFRAADSSKDYILDSWKKVDLSSLGAISKFAISFESTDMNTYGMVTPAYVCIDNIKYLLPE